MTTPGFCSTEIQTQGSVVPGEYSLSWAQSPAMEISIKVQNANGFLHGLHLPTTSTTLRAELCSPCFVLQRKALPCSERQSNFLRNTQQWEGEMLHISSGFPGNRGQVLKDATIHCHFHTRQGSPLSYIHKPSQGSLTVFQDVLDLSFPSSCCTVLGEFAPRSSPISRPQVSHFGHSLQTKTKIPQNERLWRGLPEALSSDVLKT